jgi:hypothetical protein
MSDEWCYEDVVGEDGEGECPTGGWLTGNPILVTCRTCIELFNLKHFDTVEKRCYDYGCTEDCPVNVAWRRYEQA